MLPDREAARSHRPAQRLNAPTGAWCSLTAHRHLPPRRRRQSQCTYRCVVLPDLSTVFCSPSAWRSQCTYRCVVLPDPPAQTAAHDAAVLSQCTYRCVVLPDASRRSSSTSSPRSLNAPTGAWCSLTVAAALIVSGQGKSQCTYRCVVLPDEERPLQAYGGQGLNAPTGAWCSLT